MAKMVEAVIDSARSVLANAGITDPQSTGACIVGLSGGADSVALLDVMCTLGYKCVAAHANFGLRGEESMRDEHHAAEVAKSLGVRFLSTRFDVDAYVREHRVSVEMACRELRYAWFRQLIADGVGRFIAVAHHRHDNVETFFLNLLRRAGVDGLAGMRVMHQDVVRPLLNVSKTEILSYAAQRHLEYVDDHTNFENLYERNRLRNVVIPALEAEFPGSTEAVEAAVGHLRETADFLEEIREELRRRYIDADGSLDVDAICRRWGARSAYVIFELMKSDGINRRMADEIVASQAKSGLMFGEYILDRGKLRKADRLTLCTDRVVALDKAPFSAERHPAADFRLPASAFEICLDAEVLDGNPVFELRSWREGDRMEPFGLRGSKKLSDLYRDHRYSLNDKSRALVLTRDGVILWAIGLRASRHFAVKPSTKEYILLRFKPG